MITLSSNLKQRCRAAQLKCYQFNSYGTLHAVFNVEGISDYKDQLPQTNPYNATAQVDLTMNFLLEKDTHNCQLVFLIFLGELRSSVPEPETLHQELSECYKLVEQEYWLPQVKRDLEEGRLEMPNESNDSKNAVKLVQHLLRCPQMSDREQRKEVVNQLSPEIARDITSKEQDSDFADVYNMLRTCSKHSNGVERLAYALYQLEHENETPEWQAFDKHIRDLYKINVTYTRLQQLQSILEEITWPEAVVKQAYVATPKSLEALKTSDLAHYGVYDMLSLMSNELAKMRKQSSDSTFPILEFVEHLAFYAERQQEQIVLERLRNWVERRADELGLDATQLRALRSKVKKYQPSAAYLLVKVVPQDNKMFGLQAWLMDRENNLVERTEPYISVDPVTQGDIPGCIDDIRTQYAKYLSRDLIVELLLPEELLSCNADHWLIDGGVEEDQEELGHKYKVVVRSLKRAYSKLAWADWVDKWNKFQKFKKGEKLNEAENPTERKGPVWICKEDECKEEKRFGVVLNASHVVCVALEFVPPSPNAPHIFKKVLSAGIPIALWLRDQTNHPGTVSDLFKALLLLDDLSPCPNKLSELRRLVWEERVKAVGNEHHHGYHLTLLWDNPYRLPPDSPVNLLK